MCNKCGLFVEIIADYNWPKITLRCKSKWIFTYPFKVYFKIQQLNKSPLSCIESKLFAEGKAFIYSVKFYRIRL